MIWAILVDEFRRAEDISVGEAEMVPEQGEAGLEIGHRRNLPDMRAGREIITVEKDIVRDRARLAADEGIEAPIAGYPARIDVIGAGVEVDMRRAVIDAEIAP